MIYAPRLRRPDEMVPEIDERTDAEKREDAVKLEDYQEREWERRKERGRGCT